MPGGFGTPFTQESAGVGRIVWACHDALFQGNPQDNVLGFDITGEGGAVVGSGSGIGSG